jgi:hypothetical protein
MRHAFYRLLPSVAVLALAAAQDIEALTVTNPSTTVVIAAGNDYATQVLGDPWDMTDAQDIDTDESSNLASQTIASGTYSAAASNCSTGANFYPLFQGYGAQTVATSNGRLYPIDTSTYRYLTIKIKDSTAQSTHIVFLKDGDSYTNQTFGSSFFKSVVANTWAIQTWDMYTEVFTSAPNHPWTTYPQLQGLRFDPCNTGTTNLQVDWTRLTAPASVNQTYNVTWTDTGAPATYTINAIDSGAVPYTFATGISGRSFSADFSRLPPGNYQVEVQRSDGVTATSPGTVQVNSPPLVQMTSPSKRGEQSESYAITEQGGQWGPMAATDFNPSPPPNFKTVSYAGGVFTGRPLNGDPEFLMKTTGHPIDASVYRSVCFTQEVFGTRSVGNGSVARLFWAQNTNDISTTTDIILNSGLNEYCISDLADMTAVPLVPATPPPVSWSGSMIYFRMDPDELTPPNGCSTAATCFDVQLNSIILAPWAAASPGYTFKWTVITDKPSSLLTLALDPDTTPGNGNETVIFNQPVGNGSGSFIWNGAGGPATGTYHALATIDDGTNVVSHYSTGPIVVTATDEIFKNGFETN